MDENWQVLLIDDLSILCCLKHDLLEFLVHFQWYFNMSGLLNKIIVTIYWFFKVEWYFKSIMCYILCFLKYILELRGNLKKF